MLGTATANLNVRTKLWHWDWNVHGAVRAKLIPNIGHTDLWLVDAIIDALHGLDLKCVPFELRAWERTRTDVNPLTTIGVQFAQLGIVAGIASDKALLLSGEPTQRVEVSIAPAADQWASFVAGLRGSNDDGIVDVAFERVEPAASAL